MFSRLAMVAPDSHKCYSLVVMSNCERSNIDYFFYGISDRFSVGACSSGRGYFIYDNGKTARRGQLRLLRKRAPGLQLINKVAANDHQLHSRFT